MKKKIILKILLALLTLAIIITVVILLKNKKTVIVGENGKIDDWEYSNNSYEKSDIGSILNSQSKGINLNVSNASISSATDSMMSIGESFNTDATIGF